MRAAIESSAIVGACRRAAAESVAWRAVTSLRVPGGGLASAFERAAHDEKRLTRVAPLANAAATSAVLGSLLALRRGRVAAWETSRFHALLQRTHQEWGAIPSGQRIRLTGIAIALAAAVHAVFITAAGWVVSSSAWVLIASIGAIGLALASAAQTFAAAARARRGELVIVAADTDTFERRLWVFAVAAGVLLGTAYTLSPLGIAFVVTLGLITWRASIGMDPIERRRFIAIISAAALVRIALVAALPLMVDAERESFRSLFGDAVYAIQRSTWIRNVLLGVPVAPLQAFEAFHPIYGYTGYHYVLAYLQVLFGPAPYGLHLFSGGLLLIGAILLHLEVRKSFGKRAALVALAIILFLPSLLIWSIAPLKESMSFFLMALAIVGVMRGVRSPRWPERLAALTLTVLALAGVQTLRAGALAIAGGGVALGLVLWAASARKWTLVASLVVAVSAAAILLERPGVQQSVLGVMQQAARRHLGHVLTRGSSYRALDNAFYVNRPIDTMTLSDTARFLARSAVAFVVEPTPWRDGSATERLLLPQQVVWYALVLFAVPGVVIGLKRDRLLTCLFLGTALAGLAVIAPNSGNIGTLVRHRDMIVPFVVPLGVLGATGLRERRSAH